ncbi:lysylphosphatidylglycerol synthase transmembrane domain-containing protein [Rhodocaloribacter sp.]
MSVSPPTVEETALPEELGGEEPSAPPRISWVSILWPILLSLVVLLVIGYLTFNPDDLREMLHRLNPWLMTAALGTVAARILFGGWRLYYVSHRRISFVAAVRGQLAWDFASNITPSLVGGAPLAAFYISRDSKGSSKGHVPVGMVGAWMLFVMILDQIWFALSVPFVLIAAAFIDVIPASFGAVGFWTSVVYFIALLVWTIVFAYATLMRPALLKKIAERIFRIKGLRRFQKHVDHEMSQYQHRALILRSQPLRFYVTGFLLTTGTWMARYLLLVLLVWSVVPDLDVLLAFARTAALTLGSLILPTPGGAGGVEGLYALFLGPLMPKGMVLPTLIVWRILAYYFFLASGVFVTFHTVQKNIRYRRRQKSRLDEAQKNGAGEIPRTEEKEPSL